MSASVSLAATIRRVVLSFVFFILFRYSTTLDSHACHPERSRGIPLRHPKVAPRDPSTPLRSAQDDNGQLLRTSSCRRKIQLSRTSKPSVDPIKMIVLKTKTLTLIPR